jgi:cobalt-precorrin 5A hydrolase/precorrin-3B C17-methyltransferase
VLASGLGAEEERARTALEQARLGHAAALVCSGDAGLYAMASPTLEMGAGGVDVEVVPGVTAALAAAALVGAPLGHDHALVSLSDLNTPWPAIEHRLQAVAEADLVVALYNPRSRRRTWQLPKALGILGAHRPPDTPVTVVTDATRESEQVLVTALAGLDPETVTMRSVVLVGASTTRVVDGRVVTPRGYRWLG